LAVRLRLRRVGRKKLPIYKVVAADSRSPRDGRYIESVGQYEPLRHSNNVEFKEDRVIYWLQQGAQPTDTVRNLLSSQGLWLKWSLIKKGIDENQISGHMERFEAQRIEKEQRKQEKAATKKKEKSPEKTDEPVMKAADEISPAETPEEKSEQQAAPDEEKAIKEEEATPEHKPDEKPDAQSSDK
jgi:small subunit ribosomal protein S16